MRRYVWGIAALVVLGIYGCGGNGADPTAPADTSPTPATTLSANLGQRIISGPHAQSALGIFHVALDLDTSTAVTSLARSAQASDNGYELSIEDFVTAETFTVQSVDITPTTVDVTYRVAHPIRALVNLNGPATANNRADLGAVLRTLFLAQVADADGNTFFQTNAPVVLNTDLVANADGYFQPKGLLTLGGDAVANTFPYQLVVNEAANGGNGNRVGIVGVPGSSGHGNYEPSLGGWQQSNIGPTNDGWTGYDMLHQGQSAVNTVRINRDALAGGTRFEFDVALLAKYTDPRGGANTITKRDNRLPKEEVDTAAFAYRMPYGALDTSMVRYEGETGGLIPNSLSSTTIALHVRDYDARATESAEADLGLEPNITYVQQNGSGLPSIELDIPGVLGGPVIFGGADIYHDDTNYGGDPGEDSGGAGDELFFFKNIAKPAGSSQSPGTYEGLFRVSDPEAEDATRPAYYTALAADLTPLPLSQVPDPITYQVCEVLMAVPNLTPTASASLVGTQPISIQSGGTLTAQVLDYADSEHETGHFNVDYSYEGVFEPGVAATEIGTDAAFPVLLPQSQILRNNSSASAIQANCMIQYTDGQHPAQSIILAFSLGGNKPPTASVALIAPLIVAGSTYGLNITNVVDTESNEVTFDVDWIWNGVATSFSPDLGYTNVSQSSAMASLNAPPIGNYTAGVRVKDALHQTTAIIPLAYQVVARNDQPNATFSIPNSVLSATTLTLTVTSFNDVDGDPAVVKIDWNGDGDWSDAGESGLAPLTAPNQLYVSPVLINNTSAAPLAARNVQVSYTDNVAPHLPAIVSAGTYVLGGNRPPVVTGNPALEFASLPIPATFKVLQNGATVSDPEANPITYTLNNGTTSVAWAAFPMTSGLYFNPPTSNLTFTVYANDALHPTTLGTPFPSTLAAVVCPTYVINHTFDTGTDGWLTGFGGLPNNDAQNWSAWFRCNGAGTTLVGSFWTTGPDVGGPCTLHPDDYGGNVDNNLVSPAFSLAGTTKSNLIFNSSKTGRAGASCHYIVYASANGGAWQVVNDVTKGAGTLNETNVVVALDSVPGIVGSPNVRVRFQLRDTSGASWGWSPYTGWSIDAVRVTACP